jgi:integrase
MGNFGNWENFKVMHRNRNQRVKNTDNNCRRVDKGIYQRGPASFQVKLKIEGHALSETFDTLAEARAFRDSKRAAAALDPDFKRVLAARVSKQDAAIMTLEVALKKYEEEVTPTKKGAIPETHRIAKIKRDSLALKSLYRITPEDIQDFLKGLQRHQDGPQQGKPLTDSSRRKYASLLSHLYTIAKKRWRLNVANPVDDIELPRAGKSRKRRFERDEEERLLKSLETSRNPLMKPLVQLAVETAMRQGELLSLAWQDVRLLDGHGTATLHETKNGEMRIVPLSAVACEILRQIAPETPAGKIFPMGKNSVRTAWDMACARADITGLRFHDLRHEATSRLFEMGLDKIEAASVTGHKTLQMLKDYTHLRAERLAQKINKANEN